jgi:hypothetical protein
VLDLNAIKSDLTHLYLRKVDSFVKLKNLKKAYATLSAAQRWDPAQASFYLYAIVLLILDKRMDEAKQKLLEAEKAGIEMAKEFGEVRKKLES